MKFYGLKPLPRPAVKALLKKEANPLGDKYRASNRAERRALERAAMKEHAKRG